MVMTQNDLGINHAIHIHGPSMSSIYALEASDPVVWGYMYLEQPDPISKFIVLESNYMCYEVRGRV